MAETYDGGLAGPPAVPTEPCSRPIRVLFHEDPGPGVGGSRRSLFHLIRGLGANVEATVVGGFPVEWIRRLSDTTLVITPSRVWPPRTPSRLGRAGLTAQWFWYMATTVLRLLWVIHRRRIDLVHANNEVTANAPAIVAAKLAGRPCVCHLRGESQPWRETRWLFKLVDHYIAISQEVGEFYGKQGLLPSDAVSIIHNGVDVQDLERRAEDAGRPASEGWRVGMFGRMIEFKGHQFFLEAAAQVIRRRAGVEFVIYGPVPTPGDELWPYYDLMCRKVDELGLRDHVSFAGPYSDVAQVMRATDIVACSSPYSNLGRIVIEAMACGVSLVAFDVGGMAEMASNRVNCLLVGNCDTEAMAAAVIELIEDASLRQSVIKGGHETARRLFDYRRNAAQVLELYRRLLN